MRMSHDCKESAPSIRWAMIFSSFVLCQWLTLLFPSGTLFKARGMGLEDKQYGCYCQEMFHVLSTAESYAAWCNMRNVSIHRKKC